MGKVEVEKIKVSDAETASLLIHHNKQRVKSCREIINEYKALEDVYRIGMGHRTDLEITSATTSRGSGQTTRKIISEKLGVSSSQMARLLYIDKHETEFITHIDEGNLTTNQAYWVIRKKIKDNDNISDRETPSRATSNDDYTFHHKSSKHMNELDDKSIQLVFTSPPYWNQRKYSESGEVTIGNEDTPQEYVTNLVSHLDDVKRVLRNDGSFLSWATSSTI